MLPPDVEPIAQSRRGDGHGVILLVFGAFGAGAIGYGLRCLVEWVTS